MKRIVLFAIFLMMGCESKDCQEAVREKETIILIHDLLEEKGMSFVSDFPSTNKLPICINLKKVIVKSGCFENIKANEKIVTIKIPVRTYISQGEVCIEQLYPSKPIKEGFFLVNDSLDIENQNNCFQSITIPKEILKKFKTVQYTKRESMSKEYVQFSIPIFSKDNTKAYVQYDHHSTRERFGYSLFLEKRKGKWVIVDFQKGWSSC